MVDVQLHVRLVWSAGQLRLAQRLLFAIFLVCGCWGAVVALGVVSHTLRPRFPCGLPAMSTSALCSGGLAMNDYLLGDITLFGFPPQNWIMLELAIILAGMAVASWRSSRD
jgi:hypothetical protein